MIAFRSASLNGYALPRVLGPTTQAVNDVMRRLLTEASAGL